MSKIKTPETDTIERAQSEGCGCGGHGKRSKEKAGKLAPADAGQTSEHAVHRHPDDPEHSAGCCGGHKAHK